MSEILVKIEQLKQENKILYEENMKLNVEVKSLQTQIINQATLLTTVESNFNSALEQVRTVCNDTLIQQAKETEQLINATIANENTILENNVKTLDTLKDTIDRYDQLKNEYNNYIKSQL